MIRYPWGWGRWRFEITVDLIRWGLALLWEDGQLAIVVACGALVVWRVRA